MEQIQEEHSKLQNGANLSKSIDEVQKMIDQLKTARDNINESTPLGAVAFSKLQSSIKHGFENTQDNLKEINKAHGRYSKAINNKFKDVAQPIEHADTLCERTDLINRAIMMHLSREGNFDVVGKFANESSRKASQSMPNAPAQYLSESVADTGDPAALRDQFTSMYSILEEMRKNNNLQPAIEWARERSTILEARGSNLEYDLCRLQFIKLFQSGQPSQGYMSAIRYAQETFPKFSSRYHQQTQQLTGALAFASNLELSPYADLFSSPSQTGMTLAASQFTAEFCALLSLSSASPLLTAITAGCIALPRLLKFMQIQSSVGVSWTSSNELPVEIELPREKYTFHSIFVCPVSKAQGTQENPPMMLPCGHVLCKESLDSISRGAKFKCPYCPIESNPSMAKEIFL